MKLQMRMSQRLVMTPMLQQAIKLLPMTRLELVQAIRAELEENPILEEAAEQEQELEEENQERVADVADEPLAASSEPVYEEQSSLAGGEETQNRDDIEWDAYMQSELYDGSTGEGYVERPSLENTLRQKDGLEEHLMWQLNCSAMTDEERRDGAVIIGNLNNEGYLETDLKTLAEQTGSTVDDMEDALALVQSFDPPGISARDLKECLLIQALSSGYKGTLVDTLIRHHLESLDERNYAKIAKTAGTTVEKIIEAVKAIRELDPKPGLQFNPEETHYITPDLYVVKMDDEYQVYLNDDGVPRLKINQRYQSILKNKAEDQKPTREYVENRFRSALWLIKSIEQRRQTMLKVGRSLCKFQREFLDRGINYLKPLILKDVAEDIGMHE